MKTFLTIEDLTKELNLVKASEKTSGLVPTMGALHQGHLSLVKQSRSECDVTIVSIFVNPTQFNNPDDLKKYPKTLDQDLELLESNGCDLVFVPSVKEMYPTKPELNISFGAIENALEGEHRPGHFEGVGMIISRLFTIIEPTKAYFGQKDIQQFYIIKKLIDEMGIHVDLRRAPIVRESNGLAMSSRNERLSAQERAQAAVIYQSLEQAKQKIVSGVKFPSVQQETERIFEGQSGMDLEYFEMVETKEFSSVTDFKNKEIALCIAVNVGEVRLIDNILIFS